MTSTTGTAKQKADASLTDRYVYAVLQCVPGDQRADLDREIRALVADTTDAHGGRRAGRPDRAG